MHSQHTLSMLDKSMGDMWTIVQTLTDDMLKLWQGDMDPVLGQWDENVQEHKEYWQLVRYTIVSRYNL